MSYESIKELARERGVTAQSLLALHDENDPFYCGRPSMVQDAEWFADLWKRFGFADGVHLRRIHYRIVSEGGLMMRNGEVYENTERCWDKLGVASKAARYLDLVDPAAFVDRRSPDPQIFTVRREFPVEPDWNIPELEWFLPQIQVDLNAWLPLPDPQITGYDYSLADQHYDLILWIENPP